MNLAQFKDNKERTQELCRHERNDEHEPAKIMKDQNKPWYMNYITLQMCRHFLPQKNVIPGWCGSVGHHSVHRKVAG